MKENLKLSISIVLPCYNEEMSIGRTIAKIKDVLESSNIQEYEIILVDDGSTDNSYTEALKFKTDARILRHEKNRGYGASIKTGIHKARFDWICITDIDGTYDFNQFTDLLKHTKNNDMVVGARTGNFVQYSKLRSIPKFFLVRFASYLIEEKIPDLNSGFRIFKKVKCQKFSNFYPNGFSFTTTITMLFLSTDFNVKFIPIDYYKRTGKSKINPITDTLNFLSLILKIGMYTNPLKAFCPIIYATTIGLIASLFYDIFIINNLTDKSLLIFFFLINLSFFALATDMLRKLIASNVKKE